MITPGQLAAIREIFEEGGIDDEWFLDAVTITFEKGGNVTIKIFDMNEQDVEYLKEERIGALRLEADVMDASKLTLLKTGVRK